MTDATNKLIFRLHGGQVCEALDWHEVSMESLLDERLPEAGSTGFRSGYVALIPYGYFSPFRSSRYQPRCYYVTKSQINSVRSVRSRPDLGEPWACHLAARSSDENYVSAVDQIISDIRNGRYYQLNFLRYFDATVKGSDHAMVQKFLVDGGASSFWLKERDLEVFSLSPERFVASSQGRIETFPIKGTSAAISGLPNQQYDALLQSEKDQAELNMIIDLMRNDLHRVSVRGSVKVLGSNLVMAAKGVLHTYAHIMGSLKADTRVGDILVNLCPGGSITGAPKREVMQAIHSYEGRDRGYFMGHVVYYDPEAGFLDSNILIRTLVRSQGQWEYAAGSGVGIRSQAGAELAEVTAKCQVLY